MTKKYSSVMKPVVTMTLAEVCIINYFFVTVISTIAKPLLPTHADLQQKREGTQ